MPIKLTDHKARNLTCPEGRRYAIHYDSEITGFGLRVQANGKRAFVLNYRAQGRERRYTIGSTTEWTTGGARKRAAELRQQIAAGGDPVGERQSGRQAPTVDDLFDRYMKEHVRPKNRESTGDQYEYMLDNYIRPVIGRHKVAAIQYGDIDRLHRRITSEHGPYAANRALAIMSKAFNLSVRWQMRTDNPCRGIERNQEQKRHRYLSGEELQRLAKVLDEYPYLERVRVGKERAQEIGASSEIRRRDKPSKSREQAANVVRLLLLTGARKGELLAARWDQFDLKGGVWTKPGATTKQKTQHRVPLSRAAVQLLESMPKEGEHVFAGEEGEAQKGLKRAWETIRCRADIADVRLHDLRHTYAAQLASAGLSLPIIGALLGHTQPATTARYAHLMDDPLREATERVADLWGAASGKESADVVPIKGER